MNMGEKIKYEKPEVNILIFEKTASITMSFGYSEEGYGDEIDW